MCDVLYCMRIYVVIVCDHRQSILHNLCCDSTGLYMRAGGCGVRTNHLVQTILLEQNLEDDNHKRTYIHTYILYVCTVIHEVLFCRSNLCTFKSSEIWTPPYTGQLTVVPVVSLLQRFHCTGLYKVVPMVSLVQRFHCTGLFTVVPMVSLV